ncbi:hypothetical protein ACFCYH_00855 [Streptomyces sp. NPDC056400]|uniref:hypothetical protein n=1 Tax=Streptomyces sp. NPDC056400 TaxID=3345808 RepID=UPI0035D804D0
MSESTAAGARKSWPFNRRVKALAWRTALGAAYAVGTGAVALCIRWLTANL